MLAHRDGGGGKLALKVLGAPPSACRSYVLENDPVPRALISADPNFRAAASWAPVARLLQLRQALLGPGSMLSSERFMFENVGDTFLLRWSPQAGHAVVSCGPVCVLHPDLRTCCMHATMWDWASVWRTSGDAGDGTVNAEACQSRSVHFS